MRVATSLKAALAAAVVLTSTAAAMASVPGWATGSVNVRVAPGAHNPRVDTLVAGEWVDIIDCKAGWCYIEHRGPDGWVSASYLSKRGGGPTPFPNPNNHEPDPLPPNGNPGPFPPLPPNGNPGPLPPLPQNPGPIGQPFPLPVPNPGPIPPFHFPENNGPVIKFPGPLKL